MYTKWKLTDEEVAKCEQWGVSVVKEQEAKKRAYIANGGIILNPDALEDMYEALKEARTWKGTLGIQFPAYMFDKMDKVLSQAEEK